MNCNCNGCGFPKPIVNKKYGLCDCCNSIRLHGKSKSERQAESHRKYQEKRQKQPVSNKQVNSRNLYQPEVKEGNGRSFISPSVKKLHYTIPQQTKKEARVKSALSVLKTSIELEAVQINEYYCRGCGHSHPGLDKSHILSVGRYKALELVKENIQLMCRECHKIWESGTIEEQMRLHCFADNLVFIFFYDEESFNKFLTRIEEYQGWLIPGQDQEKITFINNLINEVAARIEQAG